MVVNGACKLEIATCESHPSRASRSGSHTQRIRLLTQETSGTQLHSHLLYVANLGGLGQANVVIRRLGLRGTGRNGPSPSSFNHGWETGRRTQCMSASYLLSLHLGYPKYPAPSSKPVSHQLLDKAKICPECPQRYAICHHILSNVQKLPPLAPPLSQFP